MYKQWFRVILVGVFAGLLGACSIFGDDDDEQKPAQLENFDEEIRLQRVWSVNVGNGQGDKYNRLSPVINQDMIYAAANDGTVVAVDRESGRRQWRTRLDDTEVSGGTGYGNGMLFLGAVDARVIALDAENGELLWESQVTSEVLSTPVYGGGKVIVQTIDGKLIALDGSTGEQRWIYESTVPALSLRGTSSPLVAGNFVISGFGNGSVVSVALDNGTLRWEQRVAVPTGRTEIDRLVDIDGELLLTDNTTVVVPAYQGYLTALDINTGQVRWRQEASSVHGAASGFSNIYIANKDGAVRAYRLGQDQVVWENSALARRDLSAPATFNNYVVVGDFEGYLHFLSQVDGRFVGRTRSDRKGVRSVILARSNTLYVYGNGGRLAAYRIR